MTIDENLIRDALLRSNPSALDDILTIIEAYRTCVTAAHRMRRTGCKRQHCEQVLHCAGHCRKLLEDYAATGRLGDLHFPQSGETRFTFTLRS